jgi:hypothetical protein
MIGVITDLNSAISINYSILLVHFILISTKCLFDSKTGVIGF